MTNEMYISGEKSDYISIALRSGTIMAIVNLGGGETKVDVSPSDYRFDDNQWHHLLLTRSSRKVTPLSESVLPPIYNVFIAGHAAMFYCNFSYRHLCFMIFLAPVLAVCNRCNMFIDLYDCW